MTLTPLNGPRLVPQKTFDRLRGQKKKPYILYSSAKNYKI